MYVWKTFYTSFAWTEIPFFLWRQLYALNFIVFLSSVFGAKCCLCFWIDNICLKDFYTSFVWTETGVFHFFGWQLYALNVNVALALPRSVFDYQRCQYLWIDYSWLPLRFSLTCNYMFMRYIAPYKFMMMNST